MSYNKTLLNGNGLSSTRPTVNGGSGAWNGLKNIDWSLVRSGDILLLKRDGVYFSTDDPNTTKDVLEIAWYNGVDPAISLWGITNSTIKNNKISKNFCSGIGPTYTTCANLTITDNIITDNLLNHSRLCQGLKYGLGISGQGGHIIKGNIIRNNGGDEIIGDPKNAGLLIATSSISPVNNTEISKNRIVLNGGYQLSWYKYLTGNVLKNTHSDYNTFSGNHLFYYITMEHNDINSYNIVSSQDMHSLVIIGPSMPRNLRVK